MRQQREGLLAEAEGRKSADELQEICVDLAPKMDRMARVDRLVTGRHRRRLFGRARGRTLDVARGLGLNLRYLPDAVEYVGVDLSPYGRILLLEQGRSDVEMLARFQDWRA